MQVLANHAKYDPAWMDLAIPNATLITIIRRPESRTLSSYAYFHTPRQHRNQSFDVEADKAAYIEKVSGNKLYRYCRGRRLELAPEGVVELYDLVLLTERFAESLVLLTFEFDFQLGDLLHLSAKVSALNSRGVHVGHVVVDPEGGGVQE